ncbi:MAG: hypothetical protein ABIH83_05740 [Candidatus Micrarchaeota archaeon]
MQSSKILSGSRFLSKQRLRVSCFLAKIFRGLKGKKYSKELADERSKPDDVQKIPQKLPEEKTKIPPAKKIIVEGFEARPDEIYDPIAEELILTNNIIESMEKGHKPYEKVWGKKIRYARTDASEEPYDAEQPLYNVPFKKAKKPLIVPPDMDRDEPPQFWLEDI